MSDEPEQDNSIFVEGKSWRDALPADLRENPASQKFNDIPSLFKSYVNAQQLIGTYGADPDRLLKLPKEGEPWDEFFDKLGRPKTPDEYDYNPEGGDKDYLAAMKKAAHEAGLTQAQLEKIFGANDAYWKPRLEERQQRAKEAESQFVDQLKKEWGEGNYDKRAGLAAQAFASFGGDELKSLMDTPIGQLGIDAGAKLGDHPAIVKAFYQIAAAMQDDDATASTLDGGGFGPQDAKAQANKIMAEDKAYFDSTHPNHKATVERVQKLLAQAKG